MKFSGLSVFYSIFHSVFSECDAVIITSSYIYENVSLDTMKQWFSGMQKEVHVLGPLLPASYGIEIEHSEDRVAGTNIEAFLGKMLVQHGK